jgi:hypothetical protein
VGFWFEFVPFFDPVTFELCVSEHISFTWNSIFNLLLQLGTFIVNTNLT